jgi:hypothetical protein
MARFVLPGSTLRKIMLVASGALICACLQTPVALAQHGGGGGHGGGGHAGGGHFGGGHFGGGAHMGAPHGSAPAGHGAVSGFRSSAVAIPRARFNAGSFRFRPRPIHPRPVPPRPVPIFGFSGFFGAPFFFCGAFNSFWWPPCGPFWGPGCSFSPFYGYGGYGYGLNFGNEWPGYGSAGQATAPGYDYPPFLYGRGARDLVELFFKDGTVFDVTDYWLADGQIHFTTVDESGTKLVEHARDFDGLNLQTTIDVNTERGFRFTLRNEPLEQYLRNHPDASPQDSPKPPEN